MRCPMLGLLRKFESIHAVSLLTLLFAITVLAVSQTSYDKAWTILRDGLSNTNTDNRTVPTRLLGSLPNNTRAHDLALKAISDNRPEVRAAGAEALGNMQAQSAIPQLEQLARTDALGKRKDVSVIPALESALNDDKEGVRYTAAVAIIRLNSVKNSKPAPKPVAKTAAKPK